MKKSLDWSLFEEYVGRINDLWETEAWQKVNHHDHTNGLSQKAVNSYRREHPGSKLKTAVTTKPSKLKAGSKAAKRRKSFCARMSGNKGPMKKPNGKPTPKALALRRWHCESIEEMAHMIARGELMIAEMKQGLVEEAKHGLYYNVNKRKKAGTSRDVSSPKAPTAQAWKDAAKTAKKEGLSEMDKSQTPPGRDGGPRSGPDRVGKPSTPKKATKDAEDVLTKAFTDSQRVDPRTGKKMDKKGVAEAWSQKYKSSINCSHPKGFSQKAHCAGKKKHNEDMSMESTCPDCGMCRTHGNLNEIAKGAKDSNGVTKCWPGKHAEGTKKGRNGGQVRNCVPNESMLPANSFVGSDKNKINGKGMLRKGPAKPGKLVGGG